jgi:choline-sulfatase
MTKKPNILLFLTDDHGAWALGSASNRELHTPNLDRLAREGVRFANAFTGTPVCSPARACLLTGRTPSQVGIHDWIEESHLEFGDRDWLADEITLPQLLQQAGYYCGLSGKWHLGQSHRTPRGFDWCFGLPRHQGAHNETFTYHFNNEPLELTGNKSGFITDYALEFLRQRPQEQPFFLNVGYISTHSPYQAEAHDPELTALYDNATFSDIPEYEPHPWVKNEGFDFPEGYEAADIRARYQGYYAAVTEIDRNVGRILDVLCATGELDNTIVLYTSDHGVTLGHHGFWGKGNSTRPLNMYDTSLRVPLLWRWPGEAENSLTVMPCVDHYDTFQTLCEIAGIELDAARNYPGQSYRTLLADAAPDTTSLKWDETCFGEYGDLRSIRTPQWKLVQRHPAGPDDLFDLVNDPGETRNLSGQVSVADIETELRSRLAAFYEEHGNETKSGLRVKHLPQHNVASEAWRDGRREARGLQVY